MAYRRNQNESGIQKTGAKALVAYAVENACDNVEHSDVTIDVCDASIAVSCHSLGFTIKNSSVDFDENDDDEWHLNYAHKHIESASEGSPISSQYLRNVCQMTGMQKGQESTVVEMVKKPGGDNVSSEKILQTAFNTYTGRKGGRSRWLRLAAWPGVAAVVASVFLPRLEHAV